MMSQVHNLLVHGNDKNGTIYENKVGIDQHFQSHQSITIFLPFLNLSSNKINLRICQKLNPGLLDEKQ